MSLDARESVTWSSSKPGELLTLPVLKVDAPMVIGPHTSMRHSKLLETVASSAVGREWLTIMRTRKSHSVMRWTIFG